MDNSLNTPSPEPTVSGLKSVFKKPINLQQAFEVSMDESVTTTKSKSYGDLDKTTSGSSKAVPFKKTRKSIQRRFNVTSDDSLANSELEESLTFAKPQPVFSKKNKTLVDYFNVSYNDTNVSSQQDAFSKSIDESNIVFNKKNPFKKSTETQNGMLVADESSVGDSVKENTQPTSEESQKQSADSNNADEADSTTFITKENPFKKFSKQKNDSVSRLSISIADKSMGSKTADIQNITNNSTLNNDTDSSILRSRLNPFKQTSVHKNNSVSVTNESSKHSERGIDISKEEEVLACSMETSKNIGLDQSISKVTNNTTLGLQSINQSKQTTYLEQSSINDDNLNHWMSDQSDEEMPPPRIPSLPANLSPTKEAPVSTNETNPLSVWEQKFNEIVSNAEEKRRAVKLKLTSNTPQKRKPFKKSDQNGEKPPDDLRKYKQPKLVKPAPFANKKLYQYIIKKLEPKYGIDTMLESENLVVSICDTVKKVSRRKTHQKKLIDRLKKDMAQAGLIETTMDFYEFIIKFLPYSFRVKVVPCLQPVTNVVFPPKHVLNPFDKIL